MHQRFLRLSAAVALSFVCAAPLAQQPDASRLPPETSAAIDRLVAAEMQKQSVVGAAVGIIRDGRIADLKAYGLADREAGVPVTTGTVFNWASNSKPLAAVAAMQLVEQGKLDLDADVRTYLPEFPDKGAVITCRHLLCHQSGIPHYSNGRIVPADRLHANESDFLDPGVSLDKFSGSPLIFTPRQKTSYSSYAYVLLSAVIQRAGGEDFGKQIETRIARPLGMESFQLDLSGPDGSVPVESHPWAAGYVRRDGKVVRAPEDAHYWKHGAGGFKSDVRDFARWAEALVGHRLVSPESEQAMWTPQTHSDGSPSGYGLGFRVAGEAGRLTVSHGGEQVETSSLMVLRPESKQAVVFLANGGYVEPAPLVAAVEDALKGQ